MTHQNRVVSLFYKKDRVPFVVFENNEFWDYEGPVELIEDAKICGANRTECSGVSLSHLITDLIWILFGSEYN